MNRIYHTYNKWECYPAGFYENKPLDLTETKKQGKMIFADKSQDECKKEYSEFLKNTEAFKKAMTRVLAEWKNSCEHYLSNENMNRIAWLGQAAMCIEHGIPSIFCGGFYFMSEREQKIANETALEYLNKWLKSYGYEEISMEQAQPKTKANLY